MQKSALWLELVESSLRASVPCSNAAALHYITLANSNSQPAVMAAAAGPLACVF